MANFIVGCLYFFLTNKNTKKIEKKLEKKETAHDEN